MKLIAAMITALVCVLMLYLFHNPDSRQDNSEWLDANQLPATAACQTHAEQSNSDPTCTPSSGKVDYSPNTLH
ncbi:MAG TPA: hypothetical protein DCS87_04250 [Rheinheimera sp.]|nr:hypothetical protein [Rheinheimera sp.]